MTQLWNVTKSSLKINKMPFYWRLSESSLVHPEISSFLPFHINTNEEMDYLCFRPEESEWNVMDRAYKEDANIGFINPESGQLDTYGSSVNNFILDTINKYKPEYAFEIGCGAGFTIEFLNQHGWKVTGIDPSEYSLGWSTTLDFTLINAFFSGELLETKADFIYCNDVFEHIVDVEAFCKEVYISLEAGGMFCFATTNSTESIIMGDISMFEHQHVNMFSRRSIYLILQATGFTDIRISGGTYGNTFHVTAVKGKKKADALELPATICSGFYERAEQNISSFSNYYKNSAPLNCYVPLRCIPYLACVGDFGESSLFDSNLSWRGKFLDGYAKPIQHLDDINGNETGFFIGSMTFYEEIKTSLLKKGVNADSIFSVSSFQ